MIPQHLMKSHLVNERSKLVVEGLDLLLLVFSHLMDVWIYLQVQWCQETLVDSHFLDCTDSRGATTKSH